MAGDRGILDFLLDLPPARRQANLLLAAVRHLHGTLPNFESFRDALQAKPEELRAVMLTRTTQTNEPARCAVLLPVLAGLPQPLALLEVGASAGLCLLPERYGYAYGEHRLGAEEPVFPCEANSATPLPTRLPLVAWRAGLDLHPLDVTSAADVSWLETLVWPEQEQRRSRLRQAIGLAAKERPPLHQGDLRQDLVALLAQAPAGATRVVFHTAVLAYVTSQADRENFAEAAMRHADVWIANEAPSVFPAIAAQAPSPAPPGHFLLSVNGRPVAWTDPHGASISWFG